jgi:hypothetical protein
MTSEWEGRVPQRVLEDRLTGMASPFRNPIIEASKVTKVVRPKGALTPRQIAARQRAARSSSIQRTDAVGPQPRLD